MIFIWGKKKTQEFLRKWGKFQITYYLATFIGKLEEKETKAIMKKVIHFPLPLQASQSGSGIREREALNWVRVQSFYFFSGLNCNDGMIMRLD